MPVSWLELVLALSLMVLAAAVQGVVGMGFNIVSVPMLLLINPILAPVPNLLVSVPLSVVQAAREHAHIDFSGVGWILAGRVPGALIGLWLLVIASDRVLDIVVALTVLALVAILGRGLHVPRNPASNFGGGLLSGITGIVASMGGPPLAMLYRQERGPTIRATLAVIFTIGLLLSIAVRAAGGQIVGTDVQLAAAFLPAVLLGFALSTRLRDRFEGAPIRSAILTLSTLAALALLARSVF